MPKCSVHPEADTVSTCDGCREPFCGSCLVQFQGGRWCGPCRDDCLAELQKDEPFVTLEGICTRVYSMAFYGVLGVLIALYVRQETIALLGGVVVLLLLGLRQALALIDRKTRP